ncbi:MAG: hypothetical protein ABIR91_04110, partial [Candidatus Saccharimonadales bacterium]
MPKNNETTYRPFHYSKLHVDDTILVDFVISLQDFDYMDQQAQNDVGLPLVELAACDSVRAYNIAKFGLCRAFNAASHPTTPGYSANQHYSPGVARALQLSDFRDHLPNWRQ